MARSETGKETFSAEITAAEICCRRACEDLNSEFHLTASNGALASSGRGESGGGGNLFDRICTARDGDVHAGARKAAENGWDSWSSSAYVVSGYGYMRTSLQSDLNHGGWEIPNPLCAWTLNKTIRSDWTFIPVICCTEDVVL